MYLHPSSSLCVHINRAVELSLLVLIRMTERYTHEPITVFHIHRTLLPNFVASLDSTLVIHFYIIRKLDLNKIIKSGREIVEKPIPFSAGHRIQGSSRLQPKFDIQK